MHNSEPHARLTAQEHPWVWQLRLSPQEYERLRQDHSGPLHTIIYIAEWYKREYRAGCTAPPEGYTTAQLQQAWQASGLPWHRLVHLDAQGNRRWLYSIYVLGGLALRHEATNQTLLRQLCALWRGEDLPPAMLAGRNRAVALCQSIQDPEGSLRHYIDAIVAGDDSLLPFAPQDMQPGQPAAEFVRALREADREAASRKFRLAWVPSPSGSASIMRRLHLCLRPERDGQLHTYLMPARLRAWGIERPEDALWLRVGLRFRRGDRVVQPADMRHPLLTFVSQGLPGGGMQAWCSGTAALVRQVPVQGFTHADVVALTDDGHELTVQTLTDDECHLPWEEEEDAPTAPRMIELVAEGRVVQRDTEMVTLPYVMRLDCTYWEQTAQGIRQYDCARLRGLYDRHLGRATLADYQAWQQGRRWPATDLDPLAPRRLTVCMGTEPPPPPEEDDPFGGSAADPADDFARAAQQHLYTSMLPALRTLRHEADFAQRVWARLPHKTPQLDMAAQRMAEERGWDLNLMTT